MQQEIYMYESGTRYQEIITLEKLRIDELERQVEVLKRVLMDTGRAAGFMWPDEELAELKPLINKGLFE